MLSIIGYQLADRDCNLARLPIATAHHADGRLEDVEPALHRAFIGHLRPNLNPLNAVCSYFLDRMPGACGDRS